MKAEPARELGTTTTNNKPSRINKAVDQFPTG